MNADTGSKVFSQSLAIVNELVNTQLYQGTTYVSKVGATTGYTFGPISRTCWDTTDQYNGSFAGLVCQYSAYQRADGGDSGSPVFIRLVGGTAEIAGILHSGGVNQSNGLWEIGFSPQDGVQTDMSPYFTWRIH